ncbi:MAG: hypothetical protein E7Z99_04895 [Coriobacteriaceae bacterium]|jgi:uncharacterized protein YjdB|nr:hypothetical protein [Coriobacteriaceae bacterium]
MIRRTKAAFAAVLTAAALLCIAPASAFAVEQQESPANEVKQNETAVTAMSAPGQEGQNAAAQQVDANASQQQLAQQGNASENVETAAAPGTETPLLEAASSTGGQQLVAASTAERTEPSISYEAHVQNIGWQAAVADGAEAGTDGQALRMEAVKVTLDKGGYTGDIQMEAHVQNIGWQKVMGNGEAMGTHGQALRVEAMRLALVGEISRYYDICYQTHVQNIGWQEWVRNGELAGTTGQALRLEAIRIKLEKKKTPAAEQEEGIIGVRYQAHVQNIGWQEAQADETTAGTTGQSLRVEALRIWLDQGTLAGNIEYRAHVQNKGWTPWVKNGAIAGSTGESLRMEALQICLTGEIGQKYDVIYSGHVQNIGWQSSRNNKNTAGTTGQALRVEALKIILVSKDKRAGWFKDNDEVNWNYYEGGAKTAGRWVVTSQSPIDNGAPGQQRYWIDTAAHLATSRMIDPANAIDSGSYRAIATESGYVERNTIVEYNGEFWFADNDGRLTSPDVDALIEKAVQWAIDTANDDSHGYSQSVRWGPDYDCSSFVISAYKAAGFNVGNAVYTGNMKSELTAHGFVWSTNLSGIKRGDILLVHNDDRQHTELYLGNNRNVGAHSSENGGIYGRAGDQTGGEISITNYYSAPWEGFLRAVLR